MEQAPLELVQNEKELSDLDDKLKTLKSFQEMLKELENNTKDWHSAMESYTKLQNAAEVDETKYSKMKRAFLDQQAGILAETLVEKEPCSVCGSLEHPTPAKKHESAPTKEELDEIERIYLQSKEKSDKSSIESYRLKGMYDEKNDSVQKRGQELFPDSTETDYSEQCKKQGEEIENRLKNMKTTVSTLAKKVKEKEKIENSLPVIQKDLESKDSEMVDLRIHLADLEKDKELFEKI